MKGTMILAMDRKKQMINKEAESKLANIIFLDYVYKFGSKRKVLYQPFYFREELGIDDIKVWGKKFIKSGDVFRNEEGYLELTEKGCDLLKQNADYIEFFEAAIPYVKISDYQYYKDLRREETFESIMIAILEAKVKEFEATKEFQTIANLHYEIGKLYLKISQNDKAMIHYLNSLYIQLSGYEYVRVANRFRRGEISQKLAESAYAGVFFDPHLLKSIEDIGYIYEASMVDYLYEKGKPRAYILSSSDFKQFVFDLVNGNMEFIKWWGYFHTKYNAFIRRNKSVK